MSAYGGFQKGTSSKCSVSPMSAAGWLRSPQSGASAQGQYLCAACNRHMQLDPAHKRSVPSKSYQSATQIHRHRYMCVHATRKVIEVLLRMRLVLVAGGFGQRMHQAVEGRGDKERSR